MSQPEMAILLGSSVQAVYSWESGNAQPREVFRAKMAIVRSLTKRSARKLLEDHSGDQERDGLKPDLGRFRADRVNAQIDPPCNKPSGGIFTLKSSMPLLAIDGKTGVRVHFQRQAPETLCRRNTEPKPLRGSARK
ncbi:helix-turn-helix domain-containing protein [Lysobacter capsici]|uniref:helix-turn-helix domain-containing protein n=1 Tax=Lysobacter capsici TaxID=435897 RepID=UPI00287B94AE|nr:hypothetical protein [Lysobacter capsici]WND80490.1 hypothetical protein RJ610_24975 [Lysobacter capsici]WND85687.1 hypothetical protein RJ609_24995 [Lysobacter capsici]